MDLRTPIAVPEFAAPEGQAALGAEMADIIRYDLAFSGLFRLLPSAQYPPGFAGFSQDATAVDFDAWRETGIDYLVHGYTRRGTTAAGAEVLLQARLLEVYAGNQQVGKSLAAGEEWKRLIAHTFSEQVMQHTEGSPGVATSRIVFSGGATGDKEIYVADYDGANLRQITDYGSISITPRISPDGNRVAFVSYHEGAPFLYVADLQANSVRSVSRRPGLNVSPAWSPDGAHIALTLSKDANPEVYLMQADGSGLTRLTRDRAVDTQPAFSPDGRRIAFASDRAGSSQIYVMDRDGGNVQRLSFQGGSASAPAWSPDGSRIAYVVEGRGHGIEIYVMEASGANARQVTDTAGTNESPSWSPDGRHLIFASTRAGRSELWTANLETGEQVRVPRLSMLCQGPSWGPRRSGQQ
jgi:TolB protein